MKEVPRVKRLAVAQYYLLGNTYDDIEARTGVSHGSIVNIAREIESGDLTLPGISSDQVNDLRQLSAELRKKGAEPYQALLGLTFLDRLRTLGVTPEHLDRWAELTARLSPPDAPAQDFLEAALRLHELEQEQGRPFEDLAEDYARLQGGIEKLGEEVDSLGRSKAELSEEVGPLHRQLDALKTAKQKLESDVEIQTGRVRQLELKVKKIAEEKTRLDKEARELAKKKAGLSAEIGRREESLARINYIGLSDDDLLNLRGFLEKMVANKVISTDQVKEQFFYALGLYKDISGLEERKEAEADQMEGLAKEKSVLSGEIQKLEERKGVLEGEVNEAVSSTSQKVREIGEEAASQIQQQVADIRKQMDSLFADAVRAGQAVSVMQQMVNKGEGAEKNLKSFLKEARSRFGER